MKQLFILLCFTLVSCFSSGDNYKPLEGEQPAQELFWGEWKLTKNTYERHKKRYGYTFHPNARLFLNADSTLVLKDFVYENDESHTTKGTYKLFKYKRWDLNLKMEDKKQIISGRNIFINQHENGKILLSTFLNPDEFYIYFEKVSE